MPAVPASISDADLLNRRLFTSSPLEEPNLIMKLPAGVQMNGIIAAYDHRAFRLSCAECGAARHYKGFIIELSDGRRTLLGNHCGAKVFGSAWTHHHSQFRRLYDRQALLRRRDDLTDRLPKLIASAAALRTVIIDVAKPFADLERGFPLVMTALRRVIEKEDGWLRIDVEVPNAEDPSAAPRIEHQMLGRIAGQDAFMVRLMSTRLENARIMFAAAWREFLRDRLEDRTLNKAIKECVEAIAVLPQAVTAHNAALDFLDPRNLKLVAAWASRHPTLSDECPNGLMQRERIERREEIVIDKRRVVAIRKNLRSHSRRFTAQDLLAKAQRKGQVDSLPEKHPKLFTWKEISKPRKIVRIERTIIKAPEVKDMQRLDPAPLAEITG